MNNNLNKRIIKKISKGELVIGAVVSSSDVIFSEAMCYCGFDFIWVDGEHSSLGNREIDLHIATIRGTGVAPFVRVPSNSPYLVKPILDMGPAAIIFPNIKTDSEAKLVVSSCKYPPKGIRGYGPKRANLFSTIKNEEYLKISESEPWVILQIESLKGINNLKKIVKVEGVDCIFVGPHDLSGSIGLLGQTRHPEVLKLLDKIAEICKKSNMVFGSPVGGSSDNITDWIKRGASLLSLGNDLGYLMSGGKRDYNKVQKLLVTLQCR